MPHQALTGVLEDAARVAEKRLPIPLTGELREVLALSDFLLERADRDADWFAEFIRRADFERPFDPEAVRAAIAGACAEVENLAGLQAALRTIRQRTMVSLVWRHVSRRAPLEETMAAVSTFADACLEHALQRVHEWRVEALGEPVGATSGHPQRLVVLALGKLGARELNLSSDIDLMFAYPEAGKTATGKTNQQFFVEVCQHLVQALDTATGDGFVFRVDTRLRPFGDSGALALSFTAMEDYYERHGRDWERYALVKLRPCAGDVEAGARLVTTLRPFVFRRYLDFSAVGSLRDMKSRIDRERSASALKDDVKLGPGGIREIEFVVQMLQLIWAGKQPRLQSPALLDVLEYLESSALMSHSDARALAAAYRVLRDTEHSLQAVADRQTQQLPTAELDRARVARMAGVANWIEFSVLLDGHRRAVAQRFEQAIAAAPPAASDRAMSAGGRAALARLEAARDRPIVAPEGRDRLDELLPKLLASIDRAEVDVELALTRLVPILEAVLRRSAYLVLLSENAAATDQMVQLVAHSRWIAEQLARQPILLDDLLTSAFSSAPSRSDLLGELEARLVQSDPDDQERVMDELREFKQSHVFRVAVAETNGSLPLMRASDYLTYVGEAVVAASLDWVWRATVGALPVRGFVVVGYGKLGGLELGPGSDLDLVFLHDFGTSEHQQLHRLVRRFLHVLTTQTGRGRLYEVDTRLRPSGNSGTLVSSIAGFERYLGADAWTFEHQALIRARVIAGAPELAAQFAAIRRQVLCRRRDSATLAADVVAMRRRIRDETADETDLKRGVGSIVDIEFLVQYLVLAFAHEHEELTEFTDNVRVLATAGRLGLIDRAEAQALTEAYLALRSEWHRSVLDLPDPDRASGVMQRYQDTITRSWDRVFSSIAGR